MSSEQKLIERFAAGEHGLFADLTEPHRPELVRFAERRLGVERQLAEDVVQQALFNAYRSLLGGTRPENLRAWLFAIVRNGATNARRSTRSAAPIEDREHADLQPTVAEQVEQGEWIRWLMGAISELPARQREVIVGHAFEGLSHSELAGRSGSTVLAVKTLLHRARRRLTELRTESSMCISLLARGRLATGAKAGVGLAGQALAAATVTSVVLLAAHAPGVGSVLAAGPSPHTGGTRAPITAAHHSSHGRAHRGAAPPTPRRIHHEARRAIAACVRGRSLRHRFTPQALNYAAHHLTAMAQEYTDCESVLVRAGRAHRPSQRHNRPRRPRRT